VSTILITGGNGFVGRHLVPVLLGRGDRVRVLALPAEHTEWLRQRGVEVYRGDIRDPASLTEAVREADAVLHLAAMMDVWRPIDDYRAVNVTGTENVARAALAAGVRRFVHMSSSSVYGMGHGRPVDESFPLTAFADPYPITKAEGDRAIQRLIRDKKLPAVIIRPDQIFGPGDHLHFSAMADRLRAGRGILVGNGDNFMPFVYVDDVVRGLLLGLDHDAAPGHAYNITNDRPLTQREMLTAIATAVGASPPARRVPYRALYAAAWLAERFAALAPPGARAGRPPVTRLGVAFFGTDNRYAIGKARSELGYRPVVDLRDGVALTAAWYLRQPRPTLAEQPMQAPQPGQSDQSAQPAQGIVI